MAYFLGRDVDVYLFTEETAQNKNIGVTGAAASAPVLVVGATSVNDFAASMYAASNPTHTSSHTVQGDIVGIEVDTSTMDEDTSYMGQMQSGKVEIKKEYTVSLTRKKYNSTWDTVFNGDSAGNKARYGLNNGATGLGTGLVNPTAVAAGSSATKSCYGFRIQMVLKSQVTGAVASGKPTDNAEVLVIKNACITSYSTTLSADGVTEETIEFMSNQPAVWGGNGALINNTLTTLTEM